MAGHGPYELPLRNLDGGKIAKRTEFPENGGEEDHKGKKEKVWIRSKNIPIQKPKKCEVKAQSSTGLSQNRNRIEDCPQNFGSNEPKKRVEGVIQMERWRKIVSSKTTPFIYARV